jgi:hypothetical protein
MWLLSDAPLPSGMTESFQASEFYVRRWATSTSRPRAIGAGPAALRPPVAVDSILQMHTRPPASRSTISNDGNGLVSFTIISITMSLLINRRLFEDDVFISCAMLLAWTSAGVHAWLLFRRPATYMAWRQPLMLWHRGYRVLVLAISTQRNSWAAGITRICTAEPPELRSYLYVSVFIAIFSFTNAINFKLPQRLQVGAQRGGRLRYKTSAQSRCRAACWLLLLLRSTGCLPLRCAALAAPWPGHTLSRAALRPGRWPLCCTSPSASPAAPPRPRPLSRPPHSRRCPLCA